MFAVDISVFANMLMRRARTHSEHHRSFKQHFDVQVLCRARVPLGQRFLCLPWRLLPAQGRSKRKWRRQRGPRGHLRGENVHCGGLHRHSGAAASEPGPSPPMCWFRRRIGVFWGHKGVVLRFHATLDVRKHDNIAAWPHVCEHDCFFWGSLFFVKSRLCIWAVVSVRERDLRARAAWCGC